MIHFRILDRTLCGAKYTEPSEEAAKNGRLCNDCIQVMWKEQYRRNVLRVKKVQPPVLSLTEKWNRAWEESQAEQVVVEEPRLSPPRAIKSLRHYMKVNV
tara:strand:+ start:4000 stop:4299 length:300 start_codon:yes stop_codon:yes gene_type:complete